MERVVQVVLASAIFLLKLAQAMNIAPSDLFLVRREPRLLLLSVLAAEVTTPVITLLIILCVHPPRTIQVGLALAAVSPAPPLLISSAVGAGGRIAYAASLQRMLSLSAVVMTPFILKVLAVVMGFQALISPFAVARQVAAALFLPTLLGMLSRAWMPDLTAKIGPVLRKVAGWAYLAALLAVIARAYPLLLGFGWRSYLAVLFITGGSLLMGQLLGPANLHDRTVLALACSSRNTGLAMLIASLNFPGAKAVQGLVPYLLVSTLSTSLYLRWRKRAQA